VIKIKTNKDNKLSVTVVPKDNLKDKKFSYKLYLWLCYNSWWNKYMNDDMLRYEYILNYISINYIEEKCNISRKTISRILSGKPYRLKTDENFNKHLMFYTPKSNFIKLDLEMIKTLLELDEMSIRAYIYINSFSSNEVYGITNISILDNIGYSSKSKTNQSKLSNSLKLLVETSLIKRDIKSNGKKKYSIYYKLGETNGIKNN
jgi:hypothetical protein